MHGQIFKTINASISICARAKWSERLALLAACEEQHGLLSNYLDTAS